MLQKDRYPELDALRGIAAMMVVFFHLSMYTHASDFGLKLGYMGPELFFIISGFVIFMSLDHVSSGKEFAINRVCRLYPTYWGVVTFTFLLRFFLHAYEDQDIPRVNLVDYLGNMSMFQFYLGIEDLDGPYWSMIVEMLFYIIMLIVFSSGTTKFIYRIGIAIISISAVLVTVMWNESMDSVFKWFPFLKFSALFFMGIGFYNIITKKGKPFWNYAFVLFCFAGGMLIYKNEWFVFVSPLQFRCMIAVFFILFFLFVHGKLNFIVNKTTLFLGKISYPLYLIHNCLSRTFIVPILHKKLGWDFWLTSLGIALPACLILASIFTFGLEKPTRHLKTHLYSFFRIRKV